DPGLLGQNRRVERSALAYFRDRRCVRCRNEAGARARYGKRALETRHCREVALIGKCGGTLLVRENELETQNSKNTVSFLPCRLTFHSRMPSPAFFAIRLARRSAGTRLSTGSSAFDGSSGKYTRVTSCLSNPRMKIVISRCGACSRPSGPGTRPGLTVRKRNVPESSVSERP